MSTTNEVELEIFRTGDYGEKGTYSEGDIDQIANDYDPAMHEAPITIDHAQSGPAYGWVASLKRSGDRLVARLRNLNDKFVDLLRTGAFKNRSIELYKTFKKTGRPYLRALSFLGARPPEVKGLADVAFEDASPYTAIEFDDMNDTVTDSADPLVGSADTATLEPVATPAANADEIEAAHQQIIRLQEEKARADQEIQRLNHSLMEQELVHFCNELKRQGRFLPAWVEMGIIRFMEELPDANPLKFSEGADAAVQTPLAWFRNFLASLPVIVPLEEIAPSEPAVEMAEGDMPCPTKQAAVSERSVELHRKVKEMCRQHEGMTYADALRQIERAMEP